MNFATRRRLPSEGNVPARPHALAMLVVRRARAITSASRIPGPPFAPERYAARCGVEVRPGAVPDGIACIGPRTPRPDSERPRWLLTIDPAVPPHIPQWNGAVAVMLARTLLPPGAGGAAAEGLAELAAAELLLPMYAFRPIAARTDLTFDGVRDLAVRFAAPVRLTVRQWLQAGTWRGFALLWREEQGVLRLRWRAASPDARFPRTAAVGARADALWSSQSRLYATHRTGRPHHGVEEVWTERGPAWWFTRFGTVRAVGGEPASTHAGRAVLALVTLARG